MLYTRGNNEEAFTQTIIQRDVVTHNCAMSERLLHTPCGHRLVKQSEAICKGHWKGHLVTLQDCARSDEGHTIDILYGHTIDIWSHQPFDHRYSIEYLCFD